MLSGSAIMRMKEILGLAFSVAEIKQGLIQTQTLGRWNWLTT